MGNAVGQLMFKTSLICFLGVLLWGLLSDLSFEQVIFRSVVSALAVYFTITIYISGIRMILKSGANKTNNENVQTT